MPQKLTSAVLSRLVKPFVAEGAEKLYFCAYGNRVYAGLEPAARVSGSEERPVNFEYTIPENREVELSEIAESLDQQAQRTGYG